MMKTIYRIISSACTLLAALSVISCTGSEEALSKAEGINITFTTAAAAEAQVRSTPTAGDNSLNENLLNSVYYFLYPAGQTDVAPSVSGFKTGISETGTYQVKVPASANTIVYDLFASSNECQLFAVANPPATLVSALEGKPTLAALRAMAVASSLTEIPQANFTLVYDGPIAATSLSQKVAVNAVVEMKHLAAKFTLGAIVIPSLTQGTDTYTPDGLSVKLCNGINKTTLGGWNKDVVDGDDYFETDFKTMTNSGAVTVESETYQKYTLSSPVYSYPMEWEFNSETEPYLMYELNWKITDKDDNTAWKPLYYKLTLGSRSVMQNEWYDISAKLTVLGSLFPEEPTEIYYYMDYLVKGWMNALPAETGVNTPATIKDTRYLAVNQTEWVINNKEELIIPFSSSHDCVVTNLTATKTSFFKTSGSSDYGVHETKPVSGVDTVFLDRKGSLKINHTLDNRLLVNNASNNNMDISPIEISFTLKHADDANFAEVIHITQYPAIWVETELNSAGTNGSDQLGYILINGGRTSNNGGWQTAQGANNNYTNTNDNTCRYFVTIHVSQFDAASNTEGFVIGDPRKDVVDNLDDLRQYVGVDNNDRNPPVDFKAYSKYLGQNDQSLQFYRPTIPARTGEANSRKLYVSPAYRVSTSHAKNTGDGNYAEVMFRCATYQEDGYPAGRWRVPTYAEYKLFRYLSDAKLIPNLFVSNGNYYCAGGRFSGLNYTEGFSYTSNQGAVRCIYDEWYWSQVDSIMHWNNNNKTTFTWGDVPDDFVIPSN